MNIDASLNKVPISKALCAIVNHLEKLEGHHPATLELHSRVIRGFIAFCSNEKSQKYLNLDEERIISWMTREATRIQHPAVNFQIINRYLCLLQNTDIIPTNTMTHIKGNQSWKRIVDIFRSTNPRATLDKLRVAPPHGPLQTYILPYVELNQSLGKLYEEHRRILTHFDLFIGPKVGKSVRAIKPKHVRSWLGQMQCSTRICRDKAYILKRFLDYLIAKDALKSNPVNHICAEFGPCARRTFKPFIFTKTQIATVLDALKHLPKNHFFPLRAETCYTAVVLLYALGLRCREALNLHLGDVNLDRCILYIVQTKFFKSRIIPFGPNVAQCLEKYLAVRRKFFQPLRDDDPLFISFRRAPISSQVLRKAFCETIKSLGIKRRHSDELNPGLHGLRHSFAVHRLLRWYREGVDAQSKLPYLSTFMGHKDISATQVYLTITAELLKEANYRFYNKFGKSIEGDL